MRILGVEKTYVGVLGSLILGNTLLGVESLVLEGLDGTLANIPTDPLPLRRCFIPKRTRWRQRGELLARSAWQGWRESERPAL